jgi:nucleoside-diphosphate-sugar epimerase
MRVLVLGGTGSIGGPVVRELIRRGHSVSALARSDVSAARLSSAGAAPIAGDLSTPEQWLKSLPPLDAVIHAAAAFSEGDEKTEAHLLRCVLPFVAAKRRMTRFIYTGGCWLFGMTGGAVTDEDTPFNPLPALAWGVAHGRIVLNAPDIHSVVIHPGMVYVPTGGVFSRFHADAIGRPAVRVVGGEHVRWPLVHSEDLASLYCLALERSPPGESYLGTAIEGLAVGRIARAYSMRFGTPCADPEIISEDRIAAELGEWARGYALDQRQSGAKARRVLGWEPTHIDPESEIASLV